MVTLASEPYRRYFFAELHSNAFTFCFIIYMMAILSPLFMLMSGSSKEPIFDDLDFWISAEKEYLKNEISYTGKYALFVNYRDTSNNLQILKILSSKEAYSS